MKMKQIGLCLLVLCMGLFTACNDDDYDKNQDFTNYAEQIVGNYTGNLDSQIAETDKNGQNKTVKLTMGGHNYVLIALRNLQVPLSTGEIIDLGDVFIQNIPIAKSGDKITFDDSKEISLMKTTGNTAQVRVYGSIGSDKKLDLTIDFLKTSIEEIPSMKLSVIADKIEAEADILKMTFNNKFVSEDAFVSDDGDFSLGYLQNATLEDLKEVIVNLEISDFATVEPASGSKIDFSEGPVQFTVTAQDKVTKIVYTVTPFKMDTETQLLKITFDNKFVNKDVLVDGDGNFSLGYTTDATSEDLAAVTVNLEISEFATVEPASGSAVDFSKGPVQFTVTAQDKVTKAIYTVTPFRMNAGAQILKMTFDDKFVNEDALVGDDGNFLLGYTLDVALKDLTAVTVNMEISELATVEPASGSKVDFSKGPVQFTVTAQDKVAKTVYTVTPMATEMPFDFDLEEWFVENPKSKEIRQFMSPVGGWATSNNGVDLMKLFGPTYVPLDARCVTPTADAKTGNSAARIETLDSKGGKLLGMAIPKVTSGTLYLGTFSTDKDNTLRSTKFGIPFANKPLKFSGYYKYTSGSQFYRSSGIPNEANIAVLEPGTADMCAIGAVLYEIADENSAYLTGVDLYTADNVVAEARLKDGGAKSAYTFFSVDFEYKKGKEYDPSKKYRLAIVVSSSKDGDKFSGAPGSVLFVDDLRIVAEK